MAITEDEMDDPTTTVIEPVDTAPVVDEDKETGKGLRGQLEKQIEKTKTAEAETNRLRTQLLDRSYEELGLDPTKLVGKAIAKEYEGEASTEALAEFAKEEYGYEPVPAAPDAHPMAQQITAEQAALDQAGQTAGSVPIDLSDSDALAQAEAKGDYATTMAIKGSQVAEMFKP
jgi:ATP-dependent exoDNAse (exonuclease V) beta subunit